MSLLVREKKGGNSARKCVCVCACVSMCGLCVWCVLVCENMSVRLREHACLWCVQRVCMCACICPTPVCTVQAEMRLDPQALHSVPFAHLPVGELGKGFTLRCLSFPVQMLTGLTRGLLWLS